MKWTGTKVISEFAKHPPPGPTPLRELFADRLPYRVIHRVSLGVARSLQEFHGQQKRPHDVTVADLEQCSAWDLIKIEGVGYRAWRLLWDEMTKLGLVLKNRDARLDTLSRASLAIQEIMEDGKLSATAVAKASAFLKAQEQLLYQLDYESRRHRETAAE